MIGLGRRIYDVALMMRGFSAYAAYAFAMDFTKGIYKTAFAESTGIDALKAQRGPELVVNGDFSNGLAEWSAGVNGTLSLVAGRGRITNTGAAEGQGTHSFTPTVGKTYSFTFSVYSGAGGLRRIRFGGFQKDYGADGTYTETHTATTTTPFTIMTNSATAGAYVEADDLSVRETAGYSYTRTGATKLENEFLGYGAELLESNVINGTGWQNYLGGTVAGNLFTFTGQFVGRVNPTTTVLGKKYRLTLTARQVTGNTALHLFTEGGTPEVTAITLTASLQTFTVETTANGTSINFGIQDRNAAGHGQIEVTNVSVQEVFPQVSVTEYGPELVSNGTFDSGIAGWTAYSSATLAHSGGKMVITVNGNTQGARFDVPTVVGKTYNIGGVLSAITGTARIAVFDATLGANVLNSAYTATEGARDAYFTATTTTSVILIQGSGAGQSITADNISVKEVLSPTLTYLGTELVTNGGFDSDTIWSKGTGWTISGGKAQSAAGTATDLTQSAVMVPGLTYSCTLTVTHTSGSLDVFLGGGLDLTITASGTYTFTGVPASHGNLTLRSQSFVGSIDNVSVREVIPEAFDSFATDVPGIVPNVGYWSRPAVTNLLLRSQEFDNASWNAVGNSAAANTALAPDGTLTADTLTLTRGQAVATVASTTYTASVILKQSAANTLARLYIGGGGAGGTDRGVILNFATGLAALDAGTGTIVAHGAVALVGGWYRLWATFTTAADTTTDIIVSGGSNAGAGDNGSVYAWQAQLVAGSDPGPIIPTQGTTLTVGADVLKTGIPTLVDEDHIIIGVATFSATLPTGLEMAASFGTIYDNHISLYRAGTTGNLSAQVVVGAVNVFNPSTGMGVGNGRTVMILRRRAGKWTFYTRAGGTNYIGTESAALAMPIGVSNANPGSYVLGNAQANAPIEFVGIRKGTFSDAEITTMLGTL